MGINGVLQEWIRKWAYFNNTQIYNNIYSYLWEFYTFISLWL